MAGGIDIDVHGSHFIAGHTYFFGTNEVATLWREGNTLKCKLPPSTKPGPVYVAIDHVATGGSAARLSENGAVFTYEDKESPVQEM
jgi:hypothetical protein